MGSLLLYGGLLGRPSTSGVGLQTCTPLLCPPPQVFPYLGNSFGQPSGLLAPRYLAGYAQFGPFVYVVGGTTDVSLASSSVERTPY